MSAHNGLTDAEEERLAHLVEECGEVVKAGMKIMRHGYNSYDPTDTSLNPKSNRDDLQREIIDVKLAISKMENFGEIDTSISQAMISILIQKVKLYMHCKENK